MPYKDPEQRRLYGRTWIRNNPEKAREAMRRWRARHPELHNAEGRAYHARHRERLNARQAAYHASHPEVVRAKQQNRRAREVGAGGSFTGSEWAALVATYGGVCAYRSENGPLTADHRIPLARGGSNLIDNILPACKRCNLEKHMLTEEEFRERLKREGGGGSSEA